MHATPGGRGGGPGAARSCIYIWIWFWICRAALGGGTPRGDGGKPFSLEAVAQMAEFPAKAFSATSVGDSGPEGAAAAGTVELANANSSASSPVRSSDVNTESDAAACIHPEQVRAPAACAVCRTRIPALSILSVNGSLHVFGMTDTPVAFSLSRLLFATGSGSGISVCSAKL